jgi:hypothetical protein
MPEVFRHSPLVRGCNVPQYSIKLCTYDPTIIDAFERLRKNRKQAAFTHEALKYYFANEKGGQVLLLMEGSASEASSTIATLELNSTGAETPNDRGVKHHSIFTPQNDSSKVLDRILV